MSRPKRLDGALKILKPYETTEDSSGADYSGVPLSVLQNLIQMGSVDMEDEKEWIDGETGLLHPSFSRRNLVKTATQMEATIKIAFLFHLRQSRGEGVELKGFAVEGPLSMQAILAIKQAFSSEGELKVAPQGACWSR